MWNILKIRPKSIFVVCAALLLGVTACTTASKLDMTGMSFSSEPLLGKMIWHDLLTEDLDGARHFYGEMFGWTFEDFSGRRGNDYVVARKGDVFVAGLLAVDASADDENYSRWLPYMSVDDVDTALSRSVAGGGSIAVTARNVSLGRVAAIIDPQGAVIGLAATTMGDPDDVTTAAAPGRPVWTELLADDPEAAAAFYGSLAPYDARTLTRRGGEYTVLASNGVDRVGIFQNPAEGDYTPVWMTAFGVDDPAAAAAKAESLGGTIILPVSAELRNGTTAVVTDPSGAILVLQSWSRKGAE